MEKDELERMMGQLVQRKRKQVGLVRESWS
jgi:hypothetical protein